MTVNESTLSVEISTAESVDLDEEEVPEKQLLETWAVTAFTFSGRENTHPDNDFSQDGNVLSSHIKSALLSLHITDAREIQQLNNQFRKKNKPTNVLSFPLSDIDGIPFDGRECVMLGDIVLCAEVIRHEALVQRKSITAHWAHMVIHGLLHLQGYDHIAEEDAQQMEAREIAILQALGFNNPYEQKTNLIDSDPETITIE